ncbi:hypothetical protein D9619_007690 [Psilocybe cf. subviscida]|uniref:Nephrocystin 3-like N-terminal domain-containing protein n=1 Tax=Psilocybe cf. subviscida TaxID=2480587 RepID=A0A8H5ESK9_9AGAR|nr:hypothetical protein D9619_007690 [Psilocybe cf. subviscida]
MNVLPGATNTTIHGRIFNAMFTTKIGAQNDIFTLLYSHSATAGLLDARARYDAPNCDEGTTTKMVLGMKKFVQDGGASSSPALYWLHGPAGVGKSALAQSLYLSLKSEGDHAASFFFSRTSPGRNNGDQLIVTLAYQLASNIPALQRFMSNAVKTNPAVLTASNAVQMQTLIIDPINKWHKRYKWSVRQRVHQIVNINKKLHPRVILVDGLDECNNPDVQRDIILCIGSAVHQISIPLRFVITGRPELHILATLELDLHFHDLTKGTVTKLDLGNDKDTDAQITTFLVEKFAEIRRVHPSRDSLPRQWPRPDQIEQLVSKSSKGFSYPETVIRYIKMCNNRPDVCLERILGLSSIPTFDKPYEPLDSLYHHIFESVPEVNKSSVHNIFHFLVLPRTWNGAVTTSRTTEMHFDYMPGHVQHVLRGLRCLVAFTRDGCIKVLHASLADFLLDQSRSGPLWIDVSNAHAAIAARYLLRICHNDALPSLHSGFADFLEHMMHANLSDAILQDRLPKMDLKQGYEAIWRVASRNGIIHLNLRSQHIPPVDARSTKAVRCFKMSRRDDGDTPIQLPAVDIEGIAFMVAYLLVLVIRCGPQEYIWDQITVIKAYLLQVYPLAGSGHVVQDVLIPAMVEIKNLPQKHQAYFDSSQNEIREAIFELHFFMMAPFCLVTGISIENQSDSYKAHRVEELQSNHWARIAQGRAGKRWRGANHPILIPTTSQWGDYPTPSITPIECRSVRTRNSVRSTTGYDTFVMYFKLLIEILFAVI